MLRTGPKTKLLLDIKYHIFFFNKKHTFMLEVSKIESKSSHFRGNGSEKAFSRLILSMTLIY